jgi:endoglucanase
MENYVVNGLNSQPLATIAKSVADMGFNCVRLVFSNDLYFKNPSVNANAVKADPDLAGKSAMDVFDLTVAALSSNGVMVILNNHISDAGWCCSEDDGNGLWYTDSYPTQKWQDMWVDLAKRYANNRMVVAADLRNELRKANGVAPTWGSGDVATDWKLAAENCGNAVLEANQQLLIIVEGLDYANVLLPEEATGSTLCETCHVQKHPVKLAVPDRLVYSGHVYSWDGQFPTNNGFEAFEEAVMKYQGYVTTPNQEFTAPFWMGEFGTNSQENYWTYLIQFFKKHPEMGFAYWALDGYQHSGGGGDDETFGIFKRDYKTIRHAWKLEDLQSIQDGRQAPVTV